MVPLASLEHAQPGDDGSLQRHALRLAKVSHRLHPQEEGLHQPGQPRCPRQHATARILHRNVLEEGGRADPARRARCLAFLALEAALCSRSFVSRSSSGSSAVLLSVAKVGRTDCMRRLSERGPLSESVYGARVATRRRITKL